MMLNNCPSCGATEHLVVDSVSTTDGVKSIKYHCSADGYHGIKVFDAVPVPA